MNFKEYQEQARTFAVYRNRDLNVIYPAIGLSGEAGEVLENVKKSIRDDNYKEGDLSFPNIRKEKMLDELGDTLWYISNCASELDTDMEEIAIRNINKLTKRKMEGKIHGR